MASNESIMQALQVLASNYVHIKYQQEWVENAYSLWYDTFSNDKDNTHIADKFLLKGVAEFCRKSNADFAPNLNKFYSFLQKEFKFAEQMREEAEAEDCADCEKGKRRFVVHRKSLNEVTGEPMVREQFSICSCSCEAGRSLGLRNWRKTQEKYGQDPNVVYAFMLDRYNREFPPDAMVSQWRRGAIERFNNASLKPNKYRSSVKRLEQAAIIRDRNRIANGEQPIDRMEFIEKNREDYY